jgi:entericidin B
MAKVQRPKETSVKKIVALTLVVAALAVSACNTVAGVGRDVSAAGRAVSGAAEDIKK